MALVPTVNGPVDASKLGATLMHEHIFVRNPELEMNHPNAYWDDAMFIARARNAMLELKALGIDALVDLTVMGLGRNIPMIQKVAEGLDFNIVVATGYYTYKDLPAYFRTHGPGLRIDVPEPLYDMFVGDIREGIMGTGVKAALIKIATDEYGFTPDVERVFRAAARAHLDTGVPITTHTSARKKGGLDQQAFLRKEGVKLTNVVIGHCGDSVDLDYLRALMDAGSIIGMDRFGMDNFLPAEERIATVVKLCDQGYADRMILSHDAAVFSVNTEPEFRARFLPNWHYNYVPGTILAELGRRGVRAAQIRQMMVENPRRILTLQ
jgi:phosphotriesterase-related protein